MYPKYLTFILGYYICTGKNPEETVAEPPRRYNIVEICSLAIHLYVYTRVYLYKRTKPDLPATFASYMRINFLANIESQSFTTFATNVLSILGLGFTSYMVVYLNKLKPRQLLEYPHYLIIYFRSLIAPHIGTICAFLFFWIRSDPYKRMIREALDHAFGF